MDLQNVKGPDMAATSPSLNQSNQPANHTTTQPPRKWRRVLAAFLTGRSYNRFEAARELHDTALHSTVSRLQSFGLVIDRRMEAVPGYLGTTAHVCRYRLNPASIDAAKALLGQEVAKCA